MKKSLFALLLVVFIDSLGQGLFFPLLNTAIMSPAHSILPITTTAHMRSFYYGLVLSVFFISWFFGATFLSTASDTTGRKKALFICLYGAFIGYTLMIIAFHINSISLLLVSRIATGLTAGSQSVSQAAIIDISAPDNKAKNLGKLMLAFSVGMVAGPIIGGFFSDSHIVSFFGLTTPFYVVLLIIAINIILLKYYFQETYQPTKPCKIKISQAITNFIAAFQDKQIRKLSIVFFLMLISYNTFYVFTTAYLFIKFHFNTIDNSLFMAVLGISAAISFGYLVGPVGKYLRKKTTIILGLLILAASEAGFIFTNISWLPFVLIALFMIGFGLAYTNILIFFSSSVDKTRQGWVMGITVSLFTFGAGIVSLFGGILLDINKNLPFTLSIIGILATAVLLHFLIKEQTNHA